MMIISFDSYLFLTNPNYLLLGIIRKRNPDKLCVFLQQVKSIVYLTKKKKRFEELFENIRIKKIIWHYCITYNIGISFFFRFQALSFCKFSERYSDRHRWLEPLCTVWSWHKIPWFINFFGNRNLWRSRWFFI